MNNDINKGCSIILFIIIIILLIGAIYLLNKTFLQVI